jgi:hypothetical protein
MKIVLPPMNRFDESKQSATMISGLDASIRFARASAPTFGRSYSNDSIAFALSRHKSGDR